jgi:hypothetical protein
MTALAAIPAAASPLPGFQLVGQSEHFAFYARHGRKTETKANERFLTKTALLLDQSAEGQSAYYLHDDAEEVGAATGVYSSGMTELTSGEIHSTQAYHPHEIVHRIAAELGDPGSFFHEGLAVALGDEGKQGGVSVDVLARAAVLRYKVREAVDGFTKIEPRAAYAMAGSFVAYLIRRHGVATVAQFFRGCRPQVVVRDRHFQEVFGLRVDEAAAAWEQELSGVPMTTDRAA